MCWSTCSAPMPPARYRGRVTALAGELTAEKLGLAPARWNALADELGTIVHSAASVSFTLPHRARRGRSTCRARGGCSSWPSARAVWTATPTSRPPTWPAPTRAASASADLDVGQDVSQHLRAVEVRGRAARAQRRRPVHDPAPEHRRRRAPQRLDGGVQRPLLAAARAVARAVLRRAGNPDRARRRGAGLLRGRRDPRAVRRRRRAAERPST